MADVWRYRFYQMANGQPGYTSEVHLFDLPINTANFSTVLQGNGTFMGTVQMADPGVRAALNGQPPLFLLCDRTALYVEYDGTLVWGGILTQAKYDSLLQTCQIQGMDWWGYFAQSRLVTWNTTYTNADELLVAADLINIAQGAASSSSASPAVPAGQVVGGAVGVLLGPNATAALGGSYTSGQAQTVLYAQTSLKSVAGAISDLATALQGFDWAVNVVYVNGVPTKTFDIYYPRAGRTQQTQQASGSAVVFNMSDKDCLKYILTSGQTQTANTVYGSGSGAGNTAITSVQSNPNLLTAGWPLTEQSISYTDVTAQAQLDGLTAAAVGAWQVPVTNPELWWSPGSFDQPLGSWAIGDDARLICAPDPYFPNGYDSARGNTGEQYWRIHQWTTYVVDQGASYVDIVLGTPPVIPGM
jgi:hypothetical protein